MPIPAYATPILRRRGPNPFDRDAPRRPLRIFVDSPLLLGDVDGEGPFEGHPFIGDGPTGYPDAAAILRSYVRLGDREAFHIADDLEGVGAVVLDQPDFDRNELCFDVWRSDGVRYSGIDYIRETTEEASDQAERLGLPAAETLQGMLLPRIGNELEASITVTDRRWLLDQRSEPHTRHLSAVMSVEEALAIVALYRRWHNEP